MKSLKKLDLDYRENSLGEQNAIWVKEMFEDLNNLSVLNLNLSFNNLLVNGIVEIL